MIVVCADAVCTLEYFRFSVIKRSNAVKCEQVVSFYTLYFVIQSRKSLSEMAKVKKLYVAGKVSKKRRLLSLDCIFFSPVLYRHGSRSAHTGDSIYWILREWYFAI